MIPSAISVLSAVEGPERLYAGLARIATRPTEFFRIPADRVVEIGAEVEF